MLEYSFVGGSLAIIAVFFYLYALPVHVTDYQFYTISKVQGKYDEPIYVSFHWKTEDEIITGKQVEVWIETHLPYDSIVNLKQIEVQFKGIGYYRDTAENLFERITKDEKVTLQAEDSKGRIFKSEPIKLRYAVEGPKSVMFCDYNTQPPCTEIPDVVEVAPRSTSYEISVSKLILIGTIGLYIMTVILVLYTKRLGRYISKLNKKN